MNMEIDQSIFKEHLKTIEKQKRELNKKLKSLFSGQITLNFMLEIMYKMITGFPDLDNYIQNPNDEATIISGRTENLFYVLCELIVGVHRSKTIFYSDEERAKLENDLNYRSELIEDVYKEIKLRPCISSLLRYPQLIMGDKFLLFPVPYYLSILSVRFLSLCSQSKEMPTIYTNIANKSLAVLSLLQDNFVDCTYAACRTIIEDYFRATIFHNCQGAIKEYFNLSFFELKQSLGYPLNQEFYEKFDNRLNKNSKNRLDYLHYGWVDAIPHYHDVVKSYPYSFSGIKEYIIKESANDEFRSEFEILDYYHNMCHGYIHGSVGNSRYPLLHYFEISSILVLTTLKAYYALCKELSVDPSINETDLLVEIKKHYAFLKEAESKKSTENFDKYYKNFKAF